MKKVLFGMTEAGFMEYRSSFGWTDAQNQIE